MELEVYKTLWGAVGAAARYPTFAGALPEVAKEGFDGVAFALIAREFEPDIGNLDELADLVNRHGLGIATLIQTSGSTVEDHITSMRDQIAEASHLPNQHLICHGGLDAFDASQADHFFREALAMEADLGISIAHETHRTRILYNPWTTARIVDKFAELKLAVDLSHWVVVAERLIHDQQEIIELVGSRAIHIDARVGHSQGPQVPDPRAPEWADTVEAHVSWWQTIWGQQEAAGLETSIVVPEYGPPPYQQTVAFDGEPVSDLWDITSWAREMLLTQFASRTG